MKPAHLDLEYRRPAWSALSDILLEKDLSISRDWRITQLARTPYTLEELEKILVDEVHPACHPSLLSSNGQWPGYHLEWLEKRIVEYQQSNHPQHKLNPSRLTLAHNKEWQLTKTGIEALRTAKG